MSGELNGYPYEKLKAMKRSILLFLGILLVNYFTLSGKAAGSAERFSSEDSIKVLSTPDLYNLSCRWVAEYLKSNPDTKIKVISIEDSRAAKDLLRGGNVGLVSKNFVSSPEGENYFQFVVGRDVLVPVISSANPYIEDITKKGVPAEKLAEFFSNPDSRNWGTLLNGSQNTSVNYYYTNDKAILNQIGTLSEAGIINTEAGMEVNPDQLIESVRKDPYGFGFCRLVNLLNNQNLTFKDGIILLPIDRNNNGLLDYNEKIYDDYTNFSRAVWIGKYPKNLVSNIYAVSSKQKVNSSETAFLKWILNEGQNFLYSNGYTDILTSERKSAEFRINESQVAITSSTEEKSIFKTALIVLAIIVIAGFIIEFAVRYLSRLKKTVSTSVPVKHTVFNEESLILPGGLYFDKTHTWAFLEQNGIIKVGLDDFIQHITGPLTRLKLKNAGEKVEKGDVILSLIQNGKQLNIYAPVSGIIREINSLLTTNASLINSSPYNDGWVYRIEPTNWFRENQLLFIADKHRQFIKNEFARLKDFLSAVLVQENEKYAMVVLQDGGELIDHTLSNFGPEVWEEFQTKFIDPSRQIWFYEMF
jgi:glycine cleavage system H lipoate-binding protein/ABC-type phosphate transport system substrate-binding protein